MACRRSTLLLAALAAAPAARAGEVESREPSEKNRGAVYSWKWADNLPYEYYVPKEYDPKVGANLVLVLHGNGLDYRWTFANHDAGKFRRDDIVVSPEGTTYSELGGDYFDRLDTERLTRTLVRRLERLGHEVVLKPKEPAA